MSANVATKTKSIYRYTKLPTTPGEMVADLLRQTKILQRYFPGARDLDEDFLTTIDEGWLKIDERAEKWFIAPKWTNWPEVFGDTEEEALRRMFVAIKANEDKLGRKFRNNQADQLGPKFLHPTPDAKKFYEHLKWQQGSPESPDIFIFPAQFGARHLGTRNKDVPFCLEENECRLDAYTAAAMFLTNSEVLNFEPFGRVVCGGSTHHSRDYRDSLEHPLFFGGDADGGGTHFDGSHTIDSMLSSTGHVTGFMVS